MNRWDIRTSWETCYDDTRSISLRKGTKSQRDILMLKCFSLKLYVKSQLSRETLVISRWTKQQWWPLRVERHQYRFLNVPCFFVLKTECYRCVLLVLMMPTNSNKPCLIWLRLSVYRNTAYGVTVGPNVIGLHAQGHSQGLNQSRLMDECGDRVDFPFVLKEVPLSSDLHLFVSQVSSGFIQWPLLPVTPNPQTDRVWNLINLSSVSSFNASTYIYIYIFNEKLPKLGHSSFCGFSMLLTFPSSSSLHRTRKLQIRNIPPHLQWEVSSSSLYYVPWGLCSDCLKKIYTAAPM